MQRLRVFLFDHLHHLVERQPMILDSTKEKRKKTTIAQREAQRRQMQRQMRLLEVEKEKEREKTWEVLLDRVVVVEKQFRCFVHL